MQSLSKLKEEAEQKEAKARAEIESLNEAITTLKTFHKQEEDQLV